jgi:hypothetical protein
VSYLPKPDLMHTMHIGILDHLQMCIFHFLKMHKRLDKCIAIWFSVPGYHHLTPNYKSYEEVSRWNGKEMKEMNQYQLGFLTQSVRGESLAQRPIFNYAMVCTQALLEF